MQIFSVTSFIHFFNNLSPLRVGLLIFAILVFHPACHAGQVVIVLDPGHGGNDAGAKSDNYFEKELTLMLSQKIANRLSPRHRIVHTRTSDIHLSSEKRAAVANHTRADFMFSLHFGVGPYCSDRHASIFYHTDERLSLQPARSFSNTGPRTENLQPIWSTLQIRHQHQSLKLAELLKKEMETGGSFEQVTVESAPLSPIMGADLPAVIIEVGCMHTAETTDKIALEKKLNRYAKTISSGIDAVVSEMTREVQ